MVLICIRAQAGSRSHSTYSLELHWKSDTVWDATWLYKTLISANKFKCYVSTLKDILPCTDLLAQPCRSSVAAVRRSVLRVCSGHLPPRALVNDWSGELRGLLSFGGQNYGGFGGRISRSVSTSSLMTAGFELTLFGNEKQTMKNLMIACNLTWRG